MATFSRPKAPSLFCGMLLLVYALASHCSTSDERRPVYYQEGLLQAKENLPDAMRRSGMISSSTYQVCFSANGRNKAEALESAKRDVKDKAFLLIFQEPFIPKLLSEPGKLEIRKLIDTNGTIVKVHEESENTVTIVLHITRPGLRAYLQQLR